MQKKIVFTVTNDLTYDQRMQKICRSISAAGYEVELIGRQRHFSIELKQEPYRQTRLTCWFNKGKLFYLEYNFRLLLYLLSQRFDALCAIDLDTMLPVFIVGKWKRSKLVYDAHEYFTEVPEVMNRTTVKMIWQWVEKNFVPKFDLRYTVSDGLANLFQQKYNVPFHIILNVPPLRNENRNDIVTEKFLLYQGALNEGRGLEHLLSAMQHINIKLKLAGEGDLSHALRKQAEALQLGSKVEFLGFVPPHNLRKITEIAFIGIHVSEDKGLSYYHSLGNKFFDYIHAYIPQVCTSFPEYEKINRQHEIAVMIKSDSVGEIRNGIDRLMSDSELYERLRKNCDVCSKVYNWQNEEIKLIALYNELFR